MTPARVSISAVGGCGLNRVSPRCWSPISTPTAAFRMSCAPCVEFHRAGLAQDSCVVSRLDHVRVRGGALSFGSIFVHHSQSASHDGSNVTYLTRVGAGHRLHTLRPPP